MYRLIMNDLMEWYEDKQNKILLLKGAVGVGKTWAVIDFAHGFFERVLYMDLEKDEEASALFRRGGRIQADKLIAACSIYCGQTYEEGKTLLVLDEAHLDVRAVEAVLSLKEQCPGLPICIIASTMGKIPYEVEYADRMHCLYLYPMTFQEFLIANRERRLCDYIEKQKLEPIEAEAARRMTGYLEIFYVTGGMPLVVLDYLKNRDLDRVDAILKALLIRCKEHICRYAPDKYVEKVCKIWDSLPEQMKKDNRKFMYQYVDEKARAREYEKSVNWLVDTGLVRKVNRIREGVAPLSEQEDPKAFELYHLDHGMLRVMCGISHDEPGTEKDMFGDMGGALMEQYVLSELARNQTIESLYFWISGATARVEFVFEYNGEIAPVTIQPRIRRKVQNVKVFRSRYGSRMTIRISLDELSFGKGVLNVPLYGLWNF